MNNPKTFVENLIQECRGKNIAISGHINPDYDAIGSCLALQEILSQNGIDTDIVLGEDLDFSFEYIKQQYSFELEKVDYDILICVDMAELKLMPERVIEIKEKAQKVFNIDHHQSNTEYADYNFVEGDVSSACEVLYYLFDGFYQLNEKLASSLYIGIYADTGGFVYSNTKSSTFECLAKLIATGLNADDLLMKCFRGKKLSAFEITRLAFNSVKFYAGGRIAVSVLRFEDFKKTGAILNESKFIVSYLPTIENVEVAICASEPVKNDFHISLRTAKEGVNVSEIAKQFGGGGHIRASGLTLKGNFEKALNALINFTKYTLENKK